MPIATKSYWPALAGFVSRSTHYILDKPNLTLCAAFAFTYTTVVARNEGSAVDAARSRWYAQKERGLNALSGGQYQQYQQGHA